jgi:hypothetical protein
MTNDNHPPISFHFQHFPKGNVPEGHGNDATVWQTMTYALGNKNASLEKIEKGSVSQSGPLAKVVHSLREWNKAVRPNRGFQPEPPTPDPAQFGRVKDKLTLPP